MILQGRRHLGLLLLIFGASGCYSASFSDYEGRDAGRTKDAGRADVKPDTRKGSRPAASLPPAGVASAWLDQNAAGPPDEQPDPQGR